MGYVRDELGRFAGSTASGPPARSFEGFFQEIAVRPPTPSGHVLVIQNGAPAKVYVEGGYANDPGGLAPPEEPSEDFVVADTANASRADSVILLVPGTLIVADTANASTTDAVVVEDSTDHAIERRFTSSQASSTTTTVTLDTTGAQEGDLLLATLYTINGTHQVACPAGWMRIVDPDTGTTTSDIRHFVRWASASEPTSVTFTVTASVQCGGVLVCLAYVHPRWTSNTKKYTSNGGGTTLATAAGTFLANDGYALAFWARSGGAWGGALTPPSPMTELYEGTGMYVAEENRVPSGAYAAKTLTSPTSSATVASLVTVESALSATIPHPGVRSVSNDKGASLGTLALTLPPEAESGDLIIYAVANDATGATDLSGSTGWTAATLQGTTSMEGQIFARVLDGTTGDNILTVTGAAQDYVAAGVRIPTGDHGVTSGTIATWITTHLAVATGASGSANSPSLSPGSSDDYLWLAIGAVDHTATGGIIAGSNGGNFETEPMIFLEKSVIGSSSSCSIGIAAKQLTASTYDPPAFSSTSGLWFAWTIAVPPA